MAEVTKVFAETYKMYDENLDAFSDHWKDVVVFGPTPEDCRLRSIEAFGRTWRLSLAGDLEEVPPEGIPEVRGEPNEYGGYPVWYRVPWRDVTLAVIQAPIVPESLDYWFAQCIRLCEIRGLGLLDTSHVRSMRGTFLSCCELSELDVSGFDTGRVETMEHMFLGCSSLETLDLSGFDTAHVERMSSMFNGCSSLTRLDVSSFDTRRVREMANLFCRCSSLEELDLSGFDTSRVERMPGMFWECLALRSLDLTGFDLSSVTAMFFMFRDCPSLTSLALPGLDPERADEVNTKLMFWGADALGEDPELLVKLVRSGEGVRVGDYSVTSVPSTTTTS